MKLHRAAALALVGWYLMMPRASDWKKRRKAVVVFSGGVFGFPSAPLQRWKRQGEFDSQIECEKARQRLTTRDGPGANQLPTNAKQYFAAHAQCTSTNDPRLKEK